jgi:alpha-tubulin suppressor-like RCC1 family protein
VIGLGAAAVAIDVGLQRSCAITVGGVLACWGRNTYGEVGDGTSIDRATPVVIDALPTVASVAVADYHTCIVTTSQAAWCWGRNTSGQIGDGTTVNHSTPVGVWGLSSSIVSITAAVRHSCALRTDSTVQCWGDNGAGQLGDGSTTQRLASVQVSGLSNVAAISATDSSTCARLIDGRSARA